LGLSYNYLLVFDYKVIWSMYKLPKRKGKLPSSHQTILWKPSEY